MALDAAQFGLAPATGGAPPPDVAQFPVVAPHLAPDNSGTMTNLSDEDYGKFMRGEQPTTVKAKGEAQKPLDASQFGLTPMPSSAPPPEKQAPIPGGEPPGFLHNLAGSMAATLEGIPRGMAGNVVDYTNAATQAPLRMVTGWQGPTAAFNEGLDASRKAHERLSTEFPIANIGGELLGGAGAGAAAAPALAFRAAGPAASLMSKAGSVGDYLARNAAFGGAMSSLSGGDPTTGAAIGGGIAAVVPGVAKVASLPAAAVSRLAPLWSGAARDKSVQQTLARELGATPIASSPVGPLDLAQATNSPAMAARVRYAQGLPGAPQDAARALQEGQAAAAKGQIGQIGAPSSQADASASGVNAIRDLRGLSAQRERELWNHPALVNVSLQTQAIKQGIQTALRSLGQNEPGLLLGMTGDIRQAIDGLSKLPERANLQNINSFIGTLKAVARRPPPENARAGALAARLLSSAETGLDATVNSSGAPAAVRSAYQTARDFTRQRATVMGTQDMRAALAKNPTGAYVADPSEGLRRFFNFSNGSGEGPENIQQLIEFADQIKGALLGRGAQAEAVGAARDQLRDAARSYVASALTQASRLGEGQNFNPKLMQDFLNKNAAWMQRSGLFQRPQLQAVDRLMDYAGMLRRTEGLNPQGGSPTQGRQEVAKTFIDQIMAPWARRLAEVAMAGAGAHAHGGMGAMVGAGAGMATEAAFHSAEGAMRDLMAAAVLDSRVAKDLMMRPTRGNEAFLSAETRDLLGRLRVAIGSDVLPHLVGRSEAPVAVSK